MANKRKKCNKISIYLIKSEFSHLEFEDLLKDDVKNSINELTKTDHSVTYYISSYLHQPSWLNTYFKIDNNKHLVQSNTKVLSFHKLIIGEDKVIFAIPFGNGKNLLKDDVIEEQFGLKILLNSVDLKSFKQIQLVNCGKNFKVSSEQIPKISSLDEFVFDINSDLMRKAVAKCDDDEFFGNMITGGDVMNINIPYDKDNIEEFLKFCYKRYNEKKYLTNFSWIDNIREVKSKKEKETLNNLLVNKINDKDFDKVWMAVPENIEWEYVNCFKFAKSDNGFDDIDIIEFLKKFPNERIENFDSLKNRSVYAYSLDGEEKYSWSAHKCIMAELEFEDKVFCYNGGKWYRVNSDFSNEIIGYYNQIPVFEKDFPISNKMKEKEYNELLCKNVGGSYLMDCNLIKTGAGGHSDIELCDVLTKERELIHVKKGESSSYLSHLFNQARVSSDFLQDSKFREEVNKKIGEIYFDNNFITKDFTVVLAIITKKETERPKIPFFSKVTIKYAIEDLIRKGYVVKIKNIVGR